jgi:hypothetical protein
MLIQIADMVNFTYSIHLGSSGEFGSYKKVRMDTFSCLYVSLVSLVHFDLY